MVVVAWCCLVDSIALNRAVGKDCPDLFCCLLGLSIVIARVKALTDS